ERYEQPQLIDQEQGGTYRTPQHESGARHDDPTSAPTRQQPVSRSAAEQRAQRAAREPPHTELPPDGRDRQPVRALEEARGPRDEPVHGKRDQRTADEHPDQRRRSQHGARSLEEIAEHRGRDPGRLAGAAYGD